MGLVMSLVGKGLPSAQVLNLFVGSLHNEFQKKKINDFDDFHIAILDVFNTLNSAMPGKNFDVPSTKEVEESYEKWKEETDVEKKRLVFIEFMKNKVNLNKGDNSMMITGIVTPPAAMAAKRAGENATQLKMIKAVPDVIFIPSATMLALIVAKVSKRMFMGSIPS
ncbi:hypothetical protein RGQ29_017000 [Quercus rubra]|uniref:Calcium ion binding protein n=1 Tax=Quercus rubra TaxID=3512 RepID=A0AAN7FFI1_QUERU|nr:hypothetical protein RGQ29_017000 [Quercus rubra]